LRQLREVLGLSAEQFADRIGGGVTGRTIRRWESGEHYPSVRNLEMIVDAFNVDVEHFFRPFKEGESTPPKRPRGRPRKH